jgi:hypothetical protein
MAYRIHVCHGCYGFQELLGLVGVTMAYRIRVRHENQLYLWPQNLYSIGKFGSDA